MLIAMAVSFFLLMIIGTPVCFAIGLSTLAALLVQGDIPLVVIPQIMFGGVDRYLFLAMPFFILTGVAMSELGLTDEVVKIADALVGHIKGGLAQINIVASVIFGGIQGSGTADAAAIGSLLIPAMIKDGYKKGYSCAVTASSSCLAPIIPPSMMMVIYGGLAGVSIGEMFLAGFIPGFIMTGLMMVLAYVYAIRGAQRARRSSFSLRVLVSASGRGLPALITAFIILGGILGGVFTATESGAIAAAYALLVGAFYYRTLSWKRLLRIFVNGGHISAMVGIILSCSAVWNWILASEQVPSRILDFMVNLGLPPTAIVLCIIAFVYSVGMFMSSMACMIILVPLLAPIGLQLGYDPVHWGVLMVLVFEQGGITPPFGMNLFIATSIAECKFSETAVAVIPFVLILVIAVLLVAFVPSVTLFVPTLFMR